MVYAQERVQDDPGKCVAVTAGPGDKVVVPPGWAHYVVNTAPDSCLIFGAWCDRQYGFIYEPIRARGGLAWFPILNPDSSIRWEQNTAYRNPKLSLGHAHSYPELNVDNKVSIYEQFAVDPDCLQWVSEPARMELLWRDFEP